MGTTVNMHEAKTHLSRLVDQAERGERVIIARSGTPVAEVVPFRHHHVVFGAFRGQIEYSEAFTPEAESEVAAMFDDDVAPQDG